MVSGYPTSTSFPRVDDWSTDPWVLGCHKMFDGVVHTIVDVRHVLDLKRNLISPSD